MAILARPAVSALALAGLLACLDPATGSAGVGAGDQPALAGVVPQGAWAFDGGPEFPGVTLMQLAGEAGRVRGTLTSRWYGLMPMIAPRMQNGQLVFELRNLNDRAHAQRRWTVRFEGQQIVLTGDFWYAHIEQQGRRASAAEVRARSFHEAPPLPPAGVLPPDGLAATPPMGWSSWNAFAEKIDDATVRSIADAMVSSGLRDAGYVYVNIDDGWQGTRDARGELHPNAKFPDMRELADYLHARGLKLGLYTSPGPRSCAGYEGSYGHVRQDAERFAAWGVDYLKYDLCSGEWFYDTADTVQRAYLEMGRALRATGRPIIYSLCEYGRFDVARWGRSVGGHLWRTTHDISDGYAAMAAIGFDLHPALAPGGPGGWNDPDMLEIGNGGMSDDEYRTHMSLWALQSAPLIMGHDVRRMGESAARLLLNREVIAIDQDSRGEQGHAVWRDGGLEVWRKPLADGSVALGLFNRTAQPARIALRPSDAGFASLLTIRDLWLQRGLPVGAEALDVPAHGVALLRVAGAPASR